MKSKVKPSLKLPYKTLDEMKDTHLGKTGTVARDQYEFELKLELLGDQLKQIRQARNLTQEQLGKKVGVQKAQISKLESNLTNVTFATFMKVISALNAKANIHVKLQ